MTSPTSEPLSFNLTSAERSSLYREQTQRNIQREVMKLIGQVIKGEKPYIVQTRIATSFIEENFQNMAPGQTSQAVRQSSTQGTQETLTSTPLLGTSTQRTQELSPQLETQMSTQAQEVVGIVEEGGQGACDNVKRKRVRIPSTHGLPMLPLNQKYIQFGSKLSQKKFTLMFHLMSKIYGMVVRSMGCTIRDLYYENVLFYGTQSRLEAGLYDLCHVLHVPRDALRVEATTKGLIAGNLSFRTRTGGDINLEQFRSGMLIPTFSAIDDITEIRSEANQIIVVEKDAVFQRLIGEEVFRDIGPTILITGKGYPDLMTLKIIRKLRDSLKLKVFVLVDCDPYGVEIASVIRWGSYKQESIAKCANDPAIAEDLRVPDLIWLGLLPSELSQLSLAVKNSAELTVRDKKKITSIKQRIGRQRDEIWLHEIEEMERSGTKAELEALFIQPRFASFYIKQKLTAFYRILNRN